MKSAKLNSDYDVVDLTAIKDDYLQRCNYEISTSKDKYLSVIPSVNNHKCHEYYRIMMRTMFNLSGERTCISAIIPPQTAHVETCTQLYLNSKELILLQAAISSLPLDAYLKITNKGRMGMDVLKGFPIIYYTSHSSINLIMRLKLSCLASSLSFGYFFSAGSMWFSANFA